MANKNIQKSQQVSQSENTVIAQTMQIERHSILPPPAELKEYEKLYPGTTELLLKEFQAQAHHRMEIEKQVITSGVKNSRRGQIFAFIIALVTIIGGFTLLFFNKDIYGITAIIGAIATLAAVFIYGDISKKKERTEKSKNNP